MNHIAHLYKNYTNQPFHGLADLDQVSKRLINDGKISSYKETHIITTLEEKNSTIVLTNIREIDGCKFSQKFSIVA